MLTDTEIARRMGQRDARRWRAKYGTLPACLLIVEGSRAEMSDRLRWSGPIDSHPHYPAILTAYMRGWEGVGKGRGRPSMGQTTRVCLLLRDYDVRSIDDMATKAGMTRATWMREAILDYLSREVRKA